MLQMYTEKVLTFGRPLESDHFVQMLGNKLSVIYSTNLFKHNIYGGLSWDEMIATYLRLGVSEEAGYYKVSRME